MESDACSSDPVPARPRPCQAPPLPAQPLQLVLPVSLASFCGVGPPFGLWTLFLPPSGVLPHWPAHPSHSVGLSTILRGCGLWYILAARGDHQGTQKCRCPGPTSRTGGHREAQVFQLLELPGDSVGRDGLGERTQPGKVNLAWTQHPECVSCL